MSVCVKTRFFVLVPGKTNDEIAVPEGYNNIALFHTQDNGVVGILVTMLWFKLPPLDVKGVINMAGLSLLASFLKSSHPETHFCCAWEIRD